LLALSVFPSSEHIILPIFVKLFDSSVVVSALLDCGATASFISSSFAEKYSIPTQSLSQPTTVRTLGGSVLSSIPSDRFLHLNFDYGAHSFSEPLLVANTAPYDIVLGLAWLKKHKPRVFWDTDILTFPNTPSSLSKSLSPITQVSTDTTDPPFGNQETLYVVHLQSPAEDRPPSEIPSEYTDLAEVFSKQGASRLPPHRGPLDHSIVLESGKSPPYGPIYALSETELSTLKSYLDEMTANGFIQHSTSPAGAPLLFAKKSDGSLRPVIDYRGLNNITIKNRYPLPLITELLDRLRGAKIFTKIDLRSAYNLIRIALGDEWKTAFRTRYGHFEYKVMPFGLTNAPATFQGFIHHVLGQYLDQFCIAFLDDILIYSENVEEHTVHVRTILDTLLQNGLYANLDKCKFHKTSINFLGYIISPDGIAMEPSRVEAVSSWPEPTTTHALQVFLGFANYYRRFVNGYARIVSPMTNLLRKESQPFHWTADARTAFNHLKNAFTTAPILRHFDPNIPIRIHTDASGFALSAILSQIIDSRPHPIAFWSRKCTPPECNYGTPDRELLAVVMCVQHWRHYLEGSRHPFTIFTDHKNHESFMTTKILSRRQARWAEFLSGFDFRITFVPGPQNPADALSRRPDYENISTPASETFFHPEHFLAATLPPISSQIVNSLSHDSFAQEKILAAATDPSGLWHYKDGLLLYKNRIYVPPNNDLRLHVTLESHDQPLAGHFGMSRTIDLVSRTYYWPGMNNYIRHYVITCDICNRSKSPRHKQHGELAPLPVPPRPWLGITVDFITDLPQSGPEAYDALAIFTCRLTKMVHIIPCHKSTTTEQFAQIFLDNIVRLHGIPETIVSDRGSIFTSKFWSSLTKLLGIRRKLSTAYHPQTDGQTERFNQVIEQYLRIYCNYQQDNWVTLLTLAEFSYNNSKHASTGVSPFFANYGFNPLVLESFSVLDSSVGNPAAEQYVNELQNLHQTLVEAVTTAQNTQAKYYDAKHTLRTFQPGDKVWLLATNVHTQRPSKKLDHKRLGPYVILKSVGLQAYTLDLPSSMHIHPTFHVSLLEPYHKSTIPNRRVPPPPPVLIDDHQEYEVEGVLDSRFYHRRLQYLVSWKGLGPADNTWEPAAHLRNAPDAVTDFHRQYPNKPKPTVRRSSR
jgi:transposase InsO family protein